MADPITCRIELESSDGFIALEDGSGYLLLEDCTPVTPTVSNDIWLIGAPVEPRRRPDDEDEVLVSWYAQQRMRK